MSSGSWGCSDGEKCLLAHDLPASSDPFAQLYHTGAAARRRRKQNDYFASTTGLTAALTQRSMEEVHGVDVSWLHRPNKGEHVRRGGCWNGKERGGT